MDNPPQWDVPGWDWEDGDYSWLSSNSGAHKDGVSIYFIHGGRIHHQARVPYGSYSIEEFCAKLHQLANGLDDPQINWLSDAGDGYPSFWVGGSRAPNEDDLARLQAARDHQAYQDKCALIGLRQRHPELFR